ncbi:MAG: methylated-DNA--[protein]-cysteine S-methyltransferase [Minisyncoccia bacterium]
MTLPSLNPRLPLTGSAPVRRSTRRSPESDSLATASSVDLPWGLSRVVIGPQGVIALDLHPPFEGDYQAADVSDPLHREAHIQLRAYTQGLLTTFSLPLDPQGTPFQRAVWAALLKIPFGETRTYAQIAVAIGHPGAARAVGMACRTNPIGLVIPCHRVVGADGALTGYAGGLDLKARLLKHEGSH